MREILFRGKPKNQEHFYFFSKNWKEYCKNDFVYGSLIVKDGRYFIAVSALCNINFCVNNGCVSMIEVIPETVGQYTGLLDKNDKKIFEGDIIDTPDRLIKVVWFNKNAQFDLHFIKHTHDIIIANFKGICMRDLEAYEVVGNIHDNPELLKGE